MFRLTLNIEIPAVIVISPAKLRVQDAGRHVGDVGTVGMHNKCIYTNIM